MPYKNMHSINSEVTKKTHRDMITVIIPVYNVEKYVSECIQSVLNQTYDNLEVIIVNDGSTDHSLFICNKYLSDKRVRLINQKNGGLSRARNTGLENANGAYITFIDSDDYYIEPNAIETLYKNLVENKADISCSGWVSKEKSYNRIPNIVLFSKKEALAHLLDSTGFRCFAWNKLYKACLFEHIRFPEGKLFEDIQTQYKLISDSNNLVYTSQPLYFYRKRKDSITNKTFSDGNYDLIEAIDYVLEKVMKNHNQIINSVMAGYLYYYMTFINRAILARHDIVKHEIKVKHLIKEHNYDVISASGIDLKRKLMLCLYAYATPLYKGIVIVLMKIKSALYD